jgi:hypothetical protein
MGARTRAAANNFTTGGVILPAGINDASVASISELENTATGGAMTLISEQTASSSSSVSFTSGIDSTYPIYKFEFINIHGSTQNGDFNFNMSTDGGSNYNVTKTTSFFRTYHEEADPDTTLGYQSTKDLAQSTSDQTLTYDIDINNDDNTSGYLYLFNPSSTTYVKHFIAVGNMTATSSFMIQNFSAGYGNTTSAVNGIIFRMSAGTLDSGTIKLYGIKDS